MDGFTKLHIFVVTLRCDHSCQYCQVSRQTADKTRYDMSLATAARSVELMVRSPAQTLTLEFQGGEPLLTFDVIRYIVPLAKKRATCPPRCFRIDRASPLRLGTRNDPASRFSELRSARSRIASRCESRRRLPLRDTSSLVIPSRRRLSTSPLLRADPSSLARHKSN